jgi:hypothetical protein
MVDRLRALLDRPLNPRAGRAIVVLATAISLGFAVVTVLAGTAERSPRSTSVVVPGMAQVYPAPDSRAGELSVEEPPSSPREAHHRQDPQDNRASAAGRRAESALQSHRALQHVPFHGVGITVALAGARHGRAVLVVSAPTVGSAHRGWRKFLRRFGDTGSAYLPIFRASGDQRRHSPAEADQQATPEADQQATYQAAPAAGSFTGRKTAFAHGRRDCAESSSQRSPLHIEVCS